MGITLCLSLTIHHRNVGKNPSVSLSALNFWWVPPPKSYYLHFLLWRFSLVCMGLKRSVMWGDEPSLCRVPKVQHFFTQERCSPSLQLTSPCTLKGQSVHICHLENTHHCSLAFHLHWQTGCGTLKHNEGRWCLWKAVSAPHLVWEHSRQDGVWLAQPLLPWLDLISECLLGPIF